MPLFNSPFADLDLIRQPDRPTTRCWPSTPPTSTCWSTWHEQAPAAPAGCWCSTTASAPWPPAWRAPGRDQQRRLAPGAPGLEKNLARNGKPFDACRSYPASEHWQGPFDRVLVRVPKTLALLEEQLIRLQGHLAPARR
jgi:16S rRNA (guanine1207-N2)-methyltransferase